MEEKKVYGILIDYEFCTGCRTCEVACAQEYDHEGEVRGVRVMEIVQELPKGDHYLTYFPFFTEVCSLCLRKVRKGEKPECVKHCMARCLEFGEIEDLSEKMKKKRRTAVFRPI